MLLPQRNRSDMTEVPSRLRKRLKFVFVDNMDQVIPVALSSNRDERVTQRLASTQ